MVRDDARRWILRLRHYARALSGSVAAGDRLVVAFSTHLTTTDGPVDRALDLFQLYHDWLPEDGPRVPSFGSPVSPLRDLEYEFQQRLAGLGFLNRAMLLLVTLAEFPAAEAAAVLRLDPAIGLSLLEKAWQQAGHTSEATVLIVENDALTAMDICAQVEELGYHVIGVAATADRARQLVRSQRVDLVITDVSIGGEATGIELVEELRAASCIPIILVTGHPERASGLCCGTRIQLLSKPFDTKALQFAIMDALAADSTAQMADG